MKRKSSIKHEEGIVNRNWNSLGIKFNFPTGLCHFIFNFSFKNSTVTRKLYFVESCCQLQSVDKMSREPGVHSTSTCWLRGLIPWSLVEPRLPVPPAAVELQPCWWLRMGTLNCLHMCRLPVSKKFARNIKSQPSSILFCNWSLLLYTVVFSRSSWQSGPILSNKLITTIFVVHFQTIECFTSSPSTANQAPKWASLLAWKWKMNS